MHIVLIENLPCLTVLLCMSVPVGLCWLLTQPWSICSKVLVYRAVGSQSWPSFPGVWASPCFLHHCPHMCSWEAPSGSAGGHNPATSYVLFVSTHIELPSVLKEDGYYYYFFFNCLASDSRLLSEWELWIMQPCACLVNVNTAAAFRKGQLVFLHGCLPVTGFSLSAYKGSQVLFLFLIAFESGDNCWLEP